MTRAVVLFARDLRVNSQAALAAAARRADEVLPLFVLDRAMLAGSCAAPNRLSFLVECLLDLDRSLRALGGRLIVREGDPVREAVALAVETGAETIHLSADATPYAGARERALRIACAAERIGVEAFPGVNVLAPGAVTPPGGDHYKVFTPYWRVWSAATVQALPPAPRRLEVPPASGLSASALEARRPSGRSPELPAGGESEGRRLVERWLHEGLARYELRRDQLADAATSRLSPHLHFGTVSAPALVECLDGQPGAQEFVRQLCWRDFHQQVLAARPDIPRADYRPRERPWRADEQGAKAWREGLTGIPIVDAGMRQLLAEGYIHNRARLIVGSFLTKTLDVHWRVGAAHFARLLVDADVAANVGNWQWVAGTGNDTRPNRVLNPLRQAHRFDPEGVYVRRYVPELAGVQGGQVHEPWRLAAPERALLDYPPALVEPPSPRGRRGAQGSSSPS